MDHLKENKSDVKSNDKDDSLEENVALPVKEGDKSFDESNDNVIIVKPYRASQVQG